MEVLRGQEILTFLLAVSIMPLDDLSLMEGPEPIEIHRVDLLISYERHSSEEARLYAYEKTVRMHLTSAHRQGAFSVA